MDHKGLLFVVLLFQIGHGAIERDLLLTPKYGPPILGRIFYHDSSINDSNTLPWERALKHVTFLTLFPDSSRSADVSARSEYQEFMKVPYIQTQEDHPRFGDIVTMARGRLESISGYRRFIEEPCDGICKGRVLANWRVQKIRHRDSQRGFRYEMKFGVNPTNSPRDLQHALDEQYQRTYTLKDDDYPQQFDAVRRMIGGDEKSSHEREARIVNDVMKGPAFRFPYPSRLNIGEYMRHSPKASPKMEQLQQTELHIPTTYKPHFNTKLTTNKNYEVRDEPKTIITHHFHHHYFMKERVGSLSPDHPLIVGNSDAIHIVEGPKADLIPPEYTFKVHYPPTSTPHPARHFVPYVQTPQSKEENIPISPPAFKQSEQELDTVRYSEPDPLYTNPNIFGYSVELGTNIAGYGGVTHATVNPNIINLTDSPEPTVQIERPKIRTNPKPILVTANPIYIRNPADVLPQIESPITEIHLTHSLMAGQGTERDYGILVSSIENVSHAILGPLQATSSKSSSNDSRKKAGPWEGYNVNKIPVQTTVDWKDPATDSPTESIDDPNSNSHFSEFSQISLLDSNLKGSVKTSSKRPQNQFQWPNKKLLKNHPSRKGSAIDESQIKSKTTQSDLDVSKIGSKISSHDRQTPKTAVSPIRDSIKNMPKKKKPHFKDESEESPLRLEKPNSSIKGSSTGVGSSIEDSTTTNNSIESDEQFSTRSRPMFEHSTSITDSFKEWSPTSDPSLKDFSSITDSFKEWSPTSDLSLKDSTSITDSFKEWSPTSDLSLKDSTSITDSFKEWSPTSDLILKDSTSITDSFKEWSPTSDLSLKDSTSITDSFKEWSPTSDPSLKYSTSETDSFKHSSQGWPETSQPSDEDSTSVTSSQESPDRSLSRFRDSISVTKTFEHTTQEQPANTFNVKSLRKYPTRPLSHPKDTRIRSDFKESTEKPQKITNLVFEDSSLKESTFENNSEESLISTKSIFEDSTKITSEFSTNKKSPTKTRPHLKNSPITTASLKDSDKKSLTRIRPRLEDSTTIPYNREISYQENSGRPELNFNGNIPKKISNFPKLNKTTKTDLGNSSRILYKPETSNQKYSTRPEIALEHSINNTSSKIVSSFPNSIKATLELGQNNNIEPHTEFINESIVIHSSPQSSAKTASSLKTKSEQSLVNETLNFSKHPQQPPVSAQSTESGDGFRSKNHTSLDYVDQKFSERGNSLIRNIGTQPTKESAFESIDSNEKPSQFNNSDSKDGTQTTTEVNIVHSNDEILTTVDLRPKEKNKLSYKNQSVEESSRKSPTKKPLARNQESNDPLLKTDLSKETSASRTELHLKEINQKHPAIAEIIRKSSTKAQVSAEVSSRIAKAGSSINNDAKDLPTMMPSERFNSNTSPPTSREKVYPTETSSKVTRDKQTTRKYNFRSRNTTPQPTSQWKPKRKQKSLPNLKPPDTENRGEKVVTVTPSNLSSSISEVFTEKSVSKSISIKIGNNSEEILLLPPSVI